MLAIESEIVETDVAAGLDSELSDESKSAATGGRSSTLECNAVDTVWELGRRPVFGK